MGRDLITRRDLPSTYPASEQGRLPPSNGRRGGEAINSALNRIEPGL